MGVVEILLNKMTSYLPGAAELLQR